VSVTDSILSSALVVLAFVAMYYQHENIMLKELFENIVKQLKEIRDRLED